MAKIKFREKKYKKGNKIKPKTFFSSFSSSPSSCSSIVLLLCCFQRVHFQIFILRSTLHFAPEVVAVAGDFPVGTVTEIPSQETRIPILGLFSAPIFNFTFVSSWIANGKPFLLFIALFKVLSDELSSCWRLLIMEVFNRVVFFVSCTNPGNNPSPTSISLENTEIETGL